MSDTLTWSPTELLSKPGDTAHLGPEPAVHDALPSATRLDEFEIIRVLGAGGFGIVYLALDHVLLRYVAIKEYMPASLAGRGANLAVSLRASSHAETYAIGLESFFNEARMLASFDHPSLVKVHRFWKANGTAYMAMQYYPGRTLREVRGEMQAVPDERWLRACIEPLLGALEALHAEDIYHRDIAPDNILLLPDGRPVLLDFGSARRVIGDRTQSLTAILKPNFAPIEQYADEPGMRQGPWTDLYALGATMHFMLTGQVPVPAVLRAVRDTMRAVSDPATSSFPSIGPAFLATVDWTLALAPEDRPQSVATLRRGLSGDVQVPPFSSRQPPSAVDLTTLDAPPTPGPASTTESEPAAMPVAFSGTAPLPAATLDSAPVVARQGRLVAIACAGIFVAALAALAGGKLLKTAPPAALGNAPAASAPLTAALPLSATTNAAAPGAVVTEPAPATAVEPIAPVAVVAPSPPSRREPIRAVIAHAATEFRSTKSAPAPASVSEQTRPREAVPAQVIAAAPVKSPKELCGDLNFFAMSLCVSRQCQSPALQSHPQCVEARRFDEQRRRRMDQ